MEEDERIYKGFNLGDYSDEEKLKAIVDYLELDGENDTVEESTYDDSVFTINPRKVKHGTSPDGYKKIITEFKKLLTNRDIEEITAFINLSYASDDTRDKLYHKIDKKLQKKSDTHEAKYIEKECLYVSNVLYHLLDKKDDDFLKSYREAWFDRKIKDRRTYYDEEDGEYLVLTEDEAQQKCEDYLVDDDDMWKMAVEGGNTRLGIEEWAEQVINIDGYGSILSSYDGSEEYVGDYIIFRTN